MMKKFFCLVMVLALSVGLAACGTQETPATPVAEEKPVWEGQFAVGYGRVDVTPNYSVVMKGYTAAGEPTRMSENVLNKIYITCVAITDPAGETMLLFTYDSIMIHDGPATTLRTAVSEATGIPMDHIMISATHCHSTPDHDGKYLEFASQCAAEAAQAALADRAVATIEYAAKENPNMTFVRHYNTSNGIVVGDNFHAENAGYRTGHTTEADKEMRVVRVSREGKKPIVMVNWQGHASMASTGTTDFGKQHRNYLSSDYVGFCRDYVEQNYDCHFALYMGASGNLNPTSRMAGEPTQTTPLDYGQQLGDHVIAAMEAMTAGETGNVKLATTQFESYEKKFDIHAIGIGSIGIITAPFEMFDTTSMAVREDSPYDVTFVMTITNGYNVYMPTEECYSYTDCYEVGITPFAKGSAEKIVGIYVDLLQQTKG